jgi:hypothetical protein
MVPVTDANDKQRLVLGLLLYAAGTSPHRAMMPTLPAFFLTIIPCKRAIGYRVSPLLHHRRMSLCWLQIRCLITTTPRRRRTASILIAR